MGKNLAMLSNYSKGF